MRYIFEFPDIGEGITEGKILEWYVDKGSHVNEGDSLVKVETDKVVADIPSPKTGIIVTRYGQVGEMINVDDPLVEIDLEGDDISESEQNKGSESEGTPLMEKGFGVVGSLEEAGQGAFLPASNEGNVKIPEKPQRKKKVLATPVARAMAKKYGVNINDIQGTGPVGRVTKQDIKRFVDSVSSSRSAKDIVEPSSEVRTESVSQIRKTIAKNMVRSKSSIPHMTVFEEAWVDRLVEVRNRLKQGFAQEGISLTYLAFIIKSVALSLSKFPVLNAELDMEDEVIRYSQHAHIGIAIDTPDGLVVPVIRHADRLSIKEIAEQISTLSEKARERTLTLEDMKGGTFTITNYGSIGGLHAVPIINYPQSGILGVGRLHEKPVVRDSEIVPGQVFPLSLTVDHRIVDGGECTRFLNSVKEYLEDPVLLAVK